MSNTADQVSRHTRSLFRKIDLPLRQPMRQHATSSIWFLSILCQKTRPLARTQVEALSLPRFYAPRTKIMTWISCLTLRAFPAFRFFHLDEEIWFSMSAMMNQSSMEKPTSKGSSTNSTTLIVLSDEQMRSSASWSRITLMTPLTWLGTSKFSRHQALM